MGARKPVPRTSRWPMRLLGPTSATCRLAMSAPTAHSPLRCYPTAAHYTGPLGSSTPGALPRGTKEVRVAASPVRVMRRNMYREWPGSAVAAPASHQLQPAAQGRPAGGCCATERCAALCRQVSWHVGRQALHKDDVLGLLLVRQGVLDDAGVSAATPVRDSSGLCSDNNRALTLPQQGVQLPGR